MAQRERRRSKDISLSIHSFSLAALASGSYGLKLTGKAPAMVAEVQSGSVADKAGLAVGDFVLKASGQDTRTDDGETVLRLLKERVGQTVEMSVARPYPVPVTDKEKMRALIVLQTKLDSGTIFQPSAPAYSTAVQGALSATQDILGDLGLDLDMNQAVPNTMGQGRVQEVELKMYDSDSLPSPPASSESEGDPLLDFSRDDELTYRADQSSRSLAESVRQATQALESIQTLTANLHMRGKQQNKSPVHISSMASYTTSEPPPSSGKGWSNSPPAVESGQRSQTPPPFEVHEADLLWREPSKPPGLAEPSVKQPPPSPAVPVEPPEPALPPVPTSQPSMAGDDIPPPVPRHGRQREEPAEDERKGREREVGRRERPGLRENKERVVLRRQAPKAPPRGGLTDRVALGKMSKDRPAGVEEEVAGVSASYKKLHPSPSHPAPLPPSQDPVTDMADQETALRDLPPSILSWQSEDVAIWLFQLSPTLAHHYRPCFSRHDITGQTLMRLNLSKLKSMGIDNLKHCRQLGLEIAKLKIYQESLELRELEEENQISFL